MCGRWQLRRNYVHRKCKVICHVCKHSPEFRVAVKVSPLVPAKSYSSNHSSTVTNHLHQSKTIWARVRTQLITAAVGVAASSPTPIVVKTALEANIPFKEEAAKLIINGRSHTTTEKLDRESTCLDAVPHLVRQIIRAYTGGIACRQKSFVNKLGGQKSWETFKPFRRINS